MRLLAVAIGLAALAGPAMADTVPVVGPAPITRQEMIDIDSCAYTTGIFLQSLQEGDPTDADRALAEQTRDAMMTVGEYWDRLRRPYDRAQADRLRDEFRPPLTKRLRRYDGVADRAKGVRDEFRADMQSCLAKFKALEPARDNAIPAQDPTSPQ